jgi:DNA processing protein
MQASELRFYLALYFATGVGARRLINIREYFKGAERAFRASTQELERVPAIGSGTALALVAQRQAGLEKADEQLAKIREEQSIVTYFDEAYPELLKSIYDPPAVLFVHGDAALLAPERAIALIGSRKVTDYGKRVAHTFSEELVRGRVTIVSGFARGVDTIAHRAAVEAGGKTVAVLGSGIDVIYPANNKQFAQELIANGSGVLISELPLGTPPEARNFPWRNRIVSGLSHGVIVIESDEKGGSMITASLALDQNREVFAVPGDLGRAMSAGTNMLIRESRAKLARSAGDVLEDMGWLVRDRPQRAKQRELRTDLSLFENRIVSVLESAAEPLQIDVLSERAEIEVQDMLVHLLQLEFKSVVRQLAGKQFMLVD